MGVLVTKKLILLCCDCAMLLAPSAMSAHEATMQTCVVLFMSELQWLRLRKNPIGRVMKLRTLLQHQRALDSVIARQGAPGRKRAVEIRVRMPCAHVRMPALVLRTLGGKNGNIPFLPQRRSAAEQLRTDWRVGIY